MIISDAINYLQNTSKSKITYEQIAKVLGVSKQAIGNRVQRNSELQDFEFNKLKEHFGCIIVNKSLENNTSNDFIADFYFNTFGSFVSGKFIFSQHKIPVNISKELISSYSPQKKYSVIKSFGDSMFPVILNNDKLIIEHYAGGQIIDNQIYVFGYNQKLFIKRLVQNINQLTVISDNSDKLIYPIQYINIKEMKDIVFIGKAAGLIREFI